MSDKLLSFSQNFIISVDEMDFREQLKPSSILQYFQDLATSHATVLGIGYEELIINNMAWILSRISYKIEKFPKLGDEIKVQTFPRMPNKVEAFRDYYIFDNQNSCIIKGTSRWCVLDVNNRKIRRCDSLFNFQENQYISEIPFENGNCKLPEIDSFSEDIKGPFKFEVKITDLDRNKHMNNARYGDVVLNCCNIDELYQKNITGFDINYNSELFIGEKFYVKRTDQQQYSYFQAFKEDLRSIFIARIEWSDV